MFFSGKETHEFSPDEINNLDKLIGNTEFSFFQSFVEPVVIFDYYEQYALKLISDLCDACGMQCNCSIEYSPNANVDAFCFYNAGERKIIICEGTVLSIYKYASILSCLYKTLDLDEDDKYFERHNLIVNSAAPNGNILNTSIFISSSLKENIITDYIAMIALKIIIAHEIGHLLSGHIEYRQNSGENIISFSMSETTSNIDNTTLQVMELDADQFSACLLVNILEDELVTDEKLRAILGNDEQIYQLVGISIQCVFYLIGIKTGFWEIDNPKQYTHPPASTRVNMFLDVIRNQFGKNREDDWFQIVKGVIRAQKSIYAYYESDFKDPGKFVIDILKVDRYGQILENEWKKIKPILSKFTKMPFIE